MSSHHCICNVFMQDAVLNKPYFLSLILNHTVKSVLSFLDDEHETQKG